MEGTLLLYKIDCSKRSQNMFQVITVPAFEDNYIWLICKDNHCLAIDPGSATPVLARLDALGLTLDGILITHHHHDHCGGVAELLEHYREARLYLPRHEALPGLDGIRVDEGDLINWHGLSLTVMHLPGHTRGHVAYYGAGMLFCGDTLFSAGCGRLFEGTAEELYHSLNRIAALPDETLIYPTHEYTLSNLRFAMRVEPDNAAISDYLRQISKLRRQGLPTLPTLLKREREVNVFLRCEHENIKFNVENHLSEQLDTPLHLFSALRRWKDVF